MLLDLNRGKDKDHFISLSNEIRNNINSVREFEDYWDKKTTGIIPKLLSWKFSELRKRISEFTLPESGLAPTDDVYQKRLTAIVTLATALEKDVNQYEKDLSQYWS